MDGTDAVLLIAFLIIDTILKKAVLLSKIIHSIPHFADFVFKKASHRKNYKSREP